MANSDLTQNKNTQNKNIVANNKYTALGMTFGLTSFVAFGSDFDIAGVVSLAIMFAGMLIGARMDKNRSKQAGQTE